jgi:hypothetical protein
MKEKQALWVSVGAKVIALAFVFMAFFGEPKCGWCL